MAVHLPKLFGVSFLDPGNDNPCKTFCDPSNNLGGFCPLDCASLCENACKFVVIPVPPPPPSPAKLDFPDPPPHKSHKLHLALPVILAILTTSFFVFACYTIYKLYSYWSDSRRRRRRGFPPEDREQGRDEFLDADHGPVVDHPIWYIRTVGLQPAVISAITIVRFKKGDGLIEGTDCSVCLNEFEEDETLRLLPKCNHAFHIPCIDTWLRSHTNCPLCRAGIVNNTAGPAMPSMEVVVQNSGPGPVEEARPGGEGREMVRNEESDVRISVEDNVDSRAENGLKISEVGDNSLGPGGLDGIQGIRRSVSLDYESASMIRADIANASSRQFDGNQESDLKESRKSVECPSIERSLQIGTSSVKRSVSCSAKLFLSRYSRNSSIPQ